MRPEPAQEPQQTTSTRPARLPSLWRNRDFMLLWSGQAVSTAGTQMTLLALPLFVLALTHSAAQAGIVAAIESIPRVVLTLPAGALVDRMDRKRLMIGCDVLRMFALGSIPLALVAGRLAMPLIYGAALIIGACSAIFWLARVSAMPRVVPPEQLGAAVARSEFAEGAAILAGPPLAGLLFGIGRAFPFFVDAISYGVSALSLRFIRIPFQSEHKKEPLSPRAMLDGMRWLWRTPLMRFMALIYAGFSLSNGTELALIVRAQDLHATPFIIGLIFAAGGVGGLLGAVLAEPIQRRFRFGQVLPILAWGYPITWLLFGLVPSPLLMALVEVVSMIVDQIYDVVWPSYRMAMIPDALQGRVMSAYRVIMLSMQPVGLFAGGLLVQRVGAGHTLLLAAAVEALLAVATTLSPHVRHAPPVGDLEPRP